MLNNSDKIIPTWWCFLLLDFWSWKRHGLDIKVIKTPQPLSSNCHLVIIRLGLKMKSVIKVDDSSNQMHQDYQYSTTKGWTWLELNKLAMSNKHGMFCSIKMNSLLQSSLLYYRYFHVPVYQRSVQFVTIHDIFPILLYKSFISIDSIPVQI